ncbi:MAG: type II toxin-antitoxin system HicB family antitoxin [Chitinophagaceae bacterium]|nr:type II toxin-antitoxin system HicB family antitoxin [Chitinophagaceae bacterium]
MINYLVIFEKTKTGYSAYSPDLPGCIATGPTKLQTKKNIHAAIQFHLDGMREEHIKFPKPQAESAILTFAE